MSRIKTLKIIRRLSMETFEKELMPAEVSSKRVCIPSGNRHLFPKVGEKLVLQDTVTGDTYEAVIGSQYRLCMTEWYHRNVVMDGDKIKFSKDNGSIRVELLRPKKPIDDEVILSDNVGKQYGPISVIKLKHRPGKEPVYIIGETREMSVDEVESLRKRYER